MPGDSQPSFSEYDNPKYVSDVISHDRHRQAIGGMWDALGSLQVAFLRAQGLFPGHALIDIGAPGLFGPA